MDRKILNKNQLMKYIDSKPNQIELEIEELSDIFDKSIPVLTIKGASLDDHLRANSLAAVITVMVAKIFDKPEFKDMKYFKEVAETIKLEIDVESGMLNKTLFEIDLFKRCVIEPKFTYQEAVKISERYPELVNRVADIALDISRMDKRG